MFISKEEKAYQQIVAGVLGLIVVGIVLGVGTMVYSRIEPSIVAAGTNSSNATIASINANVYSGLQLGAISPIVMAASLILAIVMMLGAWAATR